MPLITIPYTFTVGTTISATEHNENFNTLRDAINGNLDNANIKAAAGIVDSKLAQITTASKVSGAALTLLGSIPAGAGTISTVNLPLSTDSALGTSDVLFSSQHAIKTYVDTKVFGARVDKSADYGAQTAPADGFVVVYVTPDTSTTIVTVDGYTDGNANPTTQRMGCLVQYTGASNGHTLRGSFNMPVKKGNYWKVVRSGAEISTWSVYWIPLGT